MPCVRAGILALDRGPHDRIEERYGNALKSALPIDHFVRRLGDCRPNLRLGRIAPDDFDLYNVDGILAVYVRTSPNAVPTLRHC
jgi:hypothetical protein